MPPIFKSRFSHGGLSTEVQAPCAAVMQGRLLLHRHESLIPPGAHLHDHGGGRRPLHMRGRGGQLGGESMAEPACICLQCQSTFRSGAAAAGGLAFLLCQTRCPGGITGD